MDHLAHWFSGFGYIFRRDAVESLDGIAGKRETAMAIGMQAVLEDKAGNAGDDLAQARVRCVLSRF